MSRQNLVALTVTTLLGVAMGGFVLWKGIQRRWRKTSRGAQQQQQPQQQQQQQQQVLGRREWPPPEAAQLPFGDLRMPRTSWEERILQAEVVTVSQEAEWNQIQPFLRRELADFPVLGIDCEWVS